MSFLYWAMRTAAWFRSRLQMAAKMAGSNASAETDRAIRIGRFGSPTSSSTALARAKNSSGGSATRPLASRSPGRPARRSTFAGASPRSVMSTAHPGPTVKNFSGFIATWLTCANRPALRPHSAARFPEVAGDALPSGSHPVDDPVEHSVAEQSAHEEQRLGPLAGGIADPGLFGPERFEDCVGDDRWRRPESG